jgi:hypothetical protein
MKPQLCCSPQLFWSELSMVGHPKAMVANTQNTTEGCFLEQMPVLGTSGNFFRVDCGPGRDQSG